ncbi:MAG: cell wall/surface repeat protein, partial [Mucilaginibacter sp.]|nr:cell wall/surface repeat protein [Mucilaginibacter sp.]
MTPNFTKSSGSYLSRQCRGYFKKSNSIWSLLFLLLIFAAGCKKDNFKAVQGVCPVVTTDPLDKAVDVALAKVITVTFNTSMDASTINKTTFTIQQGAIPITGTIAPTANAAVYTFTPDAPLSPFVLYTGTITTGALDKFHTALVSNFVWTFTTIPQVTVTANPVAGGVTAGGGTFAQGSVTTVTATPNTGYTFTNWTVNGVVVSTSSSYQATLAGNVALVANFAVVTPGKFAVVLSSNPVAGGKTTGSGAYNAGSDVTVTATPNAGYTFVNWTDGGVAASVSPAYTFPLNANRTLVANFKVITGSQLAVVLSSNPIAGGTTTGSGSYDAGTSVTVTANPRAGYTFVNWTNNGVIASTSPAYTFILSSNTTLVANFTNVAILAPPLFKSIFGAFGGSAGVTNQGINTVINNGGIGTTGVATLITGFHDGLTGDVYTETPLNVGLVSGGIDAAPPFPGTATKAA